MQPLFLALGMPAIVMSILPARGLPTKPAEGLPAHEVFLGKSIVLLVVGLLIGWAGPEGSIPLVRPEKI